MLTQGRFLISYQVFDNIQDIIQNPEDLISRSNTNNTDNK